MSNESSKGWTRTVVSIMRHLLYPVHFVFRLGGRATLLLAILLTVIVTPILYPLYLVCSRIGPVRITTSFPLLALAILVNPVCILYIYNINKSNNMFQVSSNDFDIIMAVTLLASLGVFAILFSKSTKQIKEGLRNIDNLIVKVIRQEWHPGMEIGQSLSLTWSCYIKESPAYAKETFCHSQRLFSALLLVCIICAVGMIPIKATKTWQASVDGRLDSLRTKADSIAIADIEEWRKNVTIELNDIENDTAPLLLLRTSGHSPAYLSETGSKISLVYRPQGNLINKKGICPEGNNLRWLQMYKEAVLRCSEDSLRHKQLIELRVRGFASAAPVRTNGDVTRSQADNCEIANQRAEAIIHFLTFDENKEYTTAECITSLNEDQRWGRIAGNLVTRGRPDANAWKESRFGLAYDDSHRVNWRGPNFIVTYKPWQDYEEMDRRKVANDGSHETPRLDLGFLNRAVEIYIVGGDCW